MQFLPLGEKVRLAGNQKCRKAETQVSCAVSPPFTSSVLKRILGGATWSVLKQHDCASFVIANTLCCSRTLHTCALHVDEVLACRMLRKAVR